MTKVVVFGLPGENELWVADLEAGSVSRMDASGSSSIKAATETRNGGESYVKGVNLAFAVESSSAAFSGFMDG